VRYGDVLSAGFSEAGVLFDSTASEGIARWAYGQVERIGGRVWIHGKTLVELSDGWERLFSPLHHS
jgi:hypothetical protein